MNYHQTPEQIIEHATAEQRILWNYIFLKFGEKISLTQFYYQGLIAGSEFLVYSANKLYLALSIEIGMNQGPTPGWGALTLYNELNVVSSQNTLTIPYWDTTAAFVKFITHPFEIKNFVFSRLTGYETIRFIGYRLSI